MAEKNPFKFSDCHLFLQKISDCHIFSTTFQTSCHPFFYKISDCHFFSLKSFRLSFSSLLNFRLSLRTFFDAFFARLHNIAVTLLHFGSKFISWCWNRRSFSYHLADDNLHTFILTSKEENPANIPTQLEN